MFFENRKIRYTKGILGQIKLFGHPIIQYEKVIDEKNPYKKEINITYPFLKNPDPDKRVFYLKVNNRRYGYSINCIQQWINIIEKMGADYYFVCDDEEVQNVILENISFSKPDIKFIKSNRKAYSYFLLKNCSKIFLNKAFATLTPYSHAEKNNFKSFWNIDADDIYFFADSTYLEEMIKKAEEYANEKDLHAFSYDTEYSVNHGLKWSFGVTFVRMDENFNNTLFKTRSEQLKEYYNHFFGAKYAQFSDLNKIFTFLKAVQQLRLETFNVTNLYHINWGKCNFNTLPQMIQATKKENIINLPIYNSILNAPFNDISQNIVSLDIKIPINHSSLNMRKHLSGYTEYLARAKRKASTIKMTTIVNPNEKQMPVFIENPSLLKKIKRRLFKKN